MEKSNNLVGSLMRFPTGWVNQMHKKQVGLVIEQIELGLFVYWNDGTTTFIRQQNIDEGIWEIINV